MEYMDAQYVKNPKRHIVRGLMVIISLYSAYMISDSVKSVACLIICILFSYLVYGLIDAKSRISEWVSKIIGLVLSNENYINKDITNYFIIAALAFITFSLLPMFGAISAENLIKGEGGGFEVKVDLVDENSDLINKSLILVIHTGGEYYLTGKNESLPDEIELYIVPDDQVKKIVIKQMGKGTWRLI
jgi:hypothetical protein